MNNNLNFFALLLVFAIGFASCEKDNLYSEQIGDQSTTDQVMLPSGKLVSVAEKGYLVFDTPDDFVAEVDFITQNADAVVLAKWTKEYPSMLAKFNALQRKSAAAGDVDPARLLTTEEAAMYLTADALRPAQTYTGFNALLSSEGLVQIGEEVHLLTDKVQVTGTPGLEEEMMSQFLTSSKAPIEGLSVIPQTVRELSYDKLNAKPMNCPSGGVAHREDRDNQRIVGEAFTNSYRYKAGLTYYHHLNWYINVYNYTTTRNGKSQHAAIGNLEIDPNGLTIQGGLFSNNVPQSGFQITPETFNTTELRNNVSYFQRMLKTQLFTSTSAFDMRTEYADGDVFIGRQGFYSPGIRLGVLIFCD